MKASVLFNCLYNKTFLQIQLIFIIAILAGMEAVAGEYVQSVAVNSGIEFDTNPRMQTDKQSVMLYRVKPNYVISNKTDSNEKYANLAFLWQKSSDETLSLNRKDPSIELGWKQFFPLGELSISSRASKTATRSSEIDESGELVGDASRIDRVVKVNWNQLLTERISANIGASYSKADFSGNTALNGFTAKRVNSSISYEWSPVFQTYALLNYTIQGLDTGNINVLNPMIGYDWQVNDRMSVGSSVGLNQISGNASGTGNAFSAYAKYINSRLTSNIELSRSLTPSGVNGFIESDKFKSSINYEISNNYTSTFSYSLNKNNSLNSNETNLYQMLLTRKLSNVWSANLSYSHRSLENDLRSATADILGFSISYNHPDF